MSNDTNNRRYAAPWDVVKVDGPCLNPPIAWGTDWDVWFQEAWGYLAAAGLTELNQALDLARVRLRALSLLWLAFDYCKAVFGESHRIHWDEWAEAYQLDTNCLALLAMSFPPVQLLDPALAFQFPEWEFDPSVSLEERIAVSTDTKNRTQGMLMTYLVTHYRLEVLKVLLDVYESPVGLLARLRRVVKEGTDEAILKGEVTEENQAEQEWMENVLWIEHSGFPSVILLNAHH